MRIGRLFIRCNGSFGQELSLFKMSEACGTIMCDAAKFALFHRVSEEVPGTVVGESRTWRNNRCNCNQEDKQRGNFHQILASSSIQRRPKCNVKVMPKTM